ncbi:gamma-glutamyltransferase [Methylobrevis albus]|uniref:Gamma-glutamyltransferase n=1 Tax=Methylobrevis albus TaxID=2793297 RepID=A0A931N0T8_9HYPH|nr:gamma-glutamyltransferase [Methylobrevis albus]MBH0239111.1 gamma-glutamyltransferase [Methylobrevis albus]
MLLPDPFSSKPRPAVFGIRAAISAAHPLATAAAQAVIEKGGNAADAAIAAQAVVGVLVPESGGIGGDGFFLVRSGPGEVTAINAAGAAPRAGLPAAIRDDGTSVNVPGLVGGWAELSQRFGRLPLGESLAPAIRIAREGMRVRPRLVTTVEQQRERLLRGGAEASVFLTARPHDLVRQPELAAALEGIAAGGADWFYGGPLGAAIASAVARRGGLMTAADLAAHETVVVPPISVTWAGRTVYVQPPMSQGILLAMALQGLGKLGSLPPEKVDHAAVELTEAAFGFRDRCGEGTALLAEELPVDLDRASGRGGPRGYLHTAGVAVADSDGTVISSLFSVFDNFGSAIYVPEGGFVLNNRAGGFTQAPNEVAPGKLPVHTLAPMLMEEEGGALALSTPGADGQVQTLLQILCSTVLLGLNLPAAIERPRWRSENGKLLVEAGHPSAEVLRALGHAVAEMPYGDIRGGGVVAAGLAGEVPYAVSDFRRENWSGAV